VAKEKKELKLPKVIIGADTYQKFTEVLKTNDKQPLVIDPVASQNFEYNVKNIPKSAFFDNTALASIVEKTKELAGLNNKAEPSAGDIQKEKLNKIINDKVDAQAIKDAKLERKIATEKLKGNKVKKKPDNYVGGGRQATAYPKEALFSDEDMAKMNAEDRAAAEQHNAMINKEQATVREYERKEENTTKSQEAAEAKIKE
jgi:hypothetical protein